MRKTNRLEAEVQRIARLDLPELRALHRELFGFDHPMPNTEHLRRKLAWQVQAKAEGGLPESARQRALAIARDTRLRLRNGGRSAWSDSASRHTVTAALASTHDSRLPLPGSLLVKEFKGRTLIVTVLVDGFEYDGRRFTSLSAVAREITGTRWNGFLFFGLNKEAVRAR